MTSISTILLLLNQPLDTDQGIDTSHFGVFINSEEVSISDIEQEYLGKDIFRLTATISNTGFQPTELAIRFATKKAVPVRAYLSVTNKSMLLDKDSEKEIDKIDGNSKEYVSWLVQGSKGNKVTINAYHPKGGRSSKKIKLIR